MLTDRYVQQITWLRLYALAMSRGLLLVPGENTVHDTQLDPVSGLPVDPVMAMPDLLSACFSRSEVNALYSQQITQGNGTSGQFIALTAQGDYLAMMERAYRAKHTTRVRRQAHAAARLAGHAHDAGLFARCLRQVQDILAQAAPATTSTETVDVATLAASENASMKRT